MRTLCGLLCLSLLGCSSGGAPDPGAADLGPQSPLVAARPYESLVPAGYDPSRPAPLLVLLHGFGTNALTQDALFGLRRFADEHGILYAFPDGTKDSSGRQFWNATDACCDRDGKKVDDVAYLAAVLDDMSARYNVDPKRIYVTGHSNGGFMSYRLACDLSGRIAAIVSLAGAMWLDEARCRPTGKVAALQVHGDMDDAVPYAGAAGRLPSARESAAFWARQNGCAATADPAAPALDLDTAVAGAETQVERFPGCQSGAAELWTMRGSGHVPSLRQPAWAEALWAFMTAHPKP